MSSMAAIRDFLAQKRIAVVAALLLTTHQSGQSKICDASTWTLRGELESRKKMRNPAHSFARRLVSVPLPSLRNGDNLAVGSGLGTLRVMKLDR